MSMTTQDAVQPGAGQPRLGRVLAWFMLPIFFIIVFPLAYVSALHAPTPHDLPIAVVGPAQVATQVATSLDDGAEFAVVAQTDVPAEARRIVRDGDAVGSILLTVSGSGQDASVGVTAYTASAAGRSTVSVVQAAAQGVAQQVGGTVRVVDLAPLAERDPLGTNLFYLLLFSSIGGYLVVITISELFGRSLRVRLTGAAITSVITPPLVFGLSAIVVGGYGASAGQVFALLGVDALYVLTCALAAILAEQILGPAITMGVILLVVFANFPSSGGAVPSSLLPPFWQGVHEFWFGAGAMESFRRIIYFDGAGVSRWLLQLGIWAVGLLLVVLVIEQTRSLRIARVEVLRARDPEHAPPTIVPKDRPRDVPRVVRIVGAVALPLFFIVSFVFAYLTALHAPAPNGLQVVVAGPRQATSQVVEGVRTQAGDAFSLSTTASAAAARDAVAQRGATGAIVIEGRDVNTVVANAGGRVAASAVTSLGEQVAQQLGGTATVEDVAPLGDNDLTGTGLFYLLIICTVGGYLSINALFQTYPKARLRSQLIITGSIALLAPTVAIALESPFVGIYGIGFPQLAALWGSAVLYTATVAMLATLLTRLLGTASTFGVTVLLLALNFPSAGGGVPASMLPGFWQGVHDVWFGAGALEAFRSIVYFNGAQSGRWLLQLSIWAVAATIIVLVVRLLQLRKERPLGSGSQRELMIPGGEAAAASL